MSLAAAGAAVVVHFLLTTTVFDLRLALTGAVALAAFWICNSVVLAAAVATIQKRRMFAFTWHLVRSDLGLLPFAYFGFLTGVLAANVSLVDGWLTLLAVLVLLDRVVIRGVPRSSVAALLGAATLIGVTAVGIGLAMMRMSGSATVPLLCAGGLIAFAAIDDVHPEFDLGVLVTAAVAGAIALRAIQPVSGPLIVVVATCLPALATCRSSRAMARSASAVVVASLTVSCTALLYQPRFGASLTLSVAFGLVAAVSGSVSWHATQLLWLTIEGKRHLYRSAVDVLAADLPIAVVGAALGAAGGWGSYRGGTQTVVLSVVVAVFALEPVTLMVRKRHAVTMLGDDDVLDVARSAVLDIPASPLRPDNAGRSRKARR
jgi:hypothetical protein